MTLTEYNTFVVKIMNADDNQCKTFIFSQVQYIEPFVQGTIGAASNMTNSKQQELLLDQAKSVTESALQFIYATKDCGGNPKVGKISL